MTNLFTHENITKIIIAGMIMGMGWMGKSIASLQRIVYTEQAHIKEMEEGQASNIRQWQKISKGEIIQAVNENDIKWLKWLTKCEGGKK